MNWSKMRKAKARAGAGKKQIKNIIKKLLNSMTIFCF